MQPVILIPARLASTRLPEKALADIGGKPMIARVIERVRPLGLPFFVATDSGAIARVVEAQGAQAIMTPVDCPSGSDRIHHALQTLDSAGVYDVVVNVQGDMPTLDADIIPAALELLGGGGFDITTLAAPIKDASELHDAAVVKIATSASGAALYFSRAPIPHGGLQALHHIGIYAYRREALTRFVALPPSPLEQCEKLEQLRALEAGMRIGVAVVDTVPLGVDNAEGLAKARDYYAYRRH